MLPSSSKSRNTTSTRVFINPNFRTATHVNPNFLIKNPPSTIHINPAFWQQNLNRDVEKQNLSDQKNLNNQIVSMEKYEEKPLAKIIEKSRTKLVRQRHISTSYEKIKTSNITRSPLIKIGLRKLVRASTAHSNKIHISEIVDDKSISELKKNYAISNNRLLNSTNAKGKYKIDRRIRKKSLSNNGVIKKKSFVSQYALNRTNSTLTTKRVFVTNKKIIRNLLRNTPDEKYLYPTTLPSSSKNKKLELLNINGVLYKSTKNKLQRSLNTNQHLNKSVLMQEKKVPGERVVFVRGNKFILDKSGLKLTNIDSTLTKELVSRRYPLKRIDIGGLTYIAKSNNVFLRTDIHMTRNHLSMAKQKSINVLYNRLVKSNIPCPIYQKLGKCLASERGKCPKVHEKKNIAICLKFLKGECINTKCLLSHNINLSKMPVCKFFLQRCCVREDCPYLHKKLSKGTEICLDFLKGYCNLADKCNKRHEYLCPDFESKGKCEKPKCPYCKRKLNNLNKNNLKSVIRDKLKLKSSATKSSEVLVENEKNSRYFIGKNDNDNLKNINNFDHEEIDESSSNSSCTNDKDADSDEVSTKTFKRPKLGDLPAFIPL